MLGVNQLDFLNYTTALKGNYRKGIHKLRAILSTKTHAEEFARNRGGVTVVLGVPVDVPDKNSDELLALLLGSSVADLAVETFLACFYEFDDLNELLAVKANCQAIQANPVTWRAVSASNVAVGKLVATLAGLSCVSYANIAAVAANSTAMKAVAASSAAMAAIWQSPAALQAVKNNATAWNTFTGASSAVMGKTVATLAGLNPASYADMNAIAASSAARAAVAASPVAMAAICASSMAVAKYAAGAAGLNPADYADMSAIAASSAAMAAVAASSAAMAAVAASSAAMAAVAASATARSAVYASGTAKAALDSSPLKVTVRAHYSTQSNNQYTNLNRKAFILKTTGYGSGTWTFFNVYDPPTASGTTTKAMGTGNAFSLYLVGTSITTQHGGGSTSDYIDIQYIPV